jgi:hypothetical protein
MTEPTSAPGALTPARRLQLLREILHGGHSIRADSSTDALAGAEIKLAEWRELDSLKDINLRTIHGTIGRAEGVRVVLAILTPSGMRFLQEHASEPYAPSRIA